MSNKNKQDTTFWGFFVRNIRLAYLIILALVVFGVFAIVQMPKESAPEIDIPVAVVSTSLPGGSPADVEELVTNPLEDSIQGLSNISELTSTSQRGLSQIVVQFTTDSDTSESVTELRNRVSQAESELPADANDPQVQQISFADQPILTLAVSGPFNRTQLGDYADTIASQAEEITSVSNANVSGDPTDEYVITVRQSDLSRYGLSVTDLVANIRQANTNMPIGSIESGGKVYTVRFAGRLESAEDIRAIPITTSQNTTIQLEEIAQVQQQPAPLSVRNRLSVGGQSPQPTVSVDVFKESGEGNIIAIVNQLQTEIDAMTGDELPDDLTTETIRNDAEQITADLNNLVSSGIITVLIIFTVLVLFLGWREAVLASLAIPLTFLAGLGVMYMFGYTLNFLTLFSLILVLGILVDAAIVVTEGFSRELQASNSPTESAYATLAEFQAPLTTGTLTTVFVFAPMLLAGGIIGQFIATIPVTVSSVLLCALFVALALLTALGARFFRRQGRRGASQRIRSWIDRVYGWYSDFLQRTLQKTRRRTQIFVVMTVLFVAAVALPFLGLLQTTLFPPGDMPMITVNLEMPEGTPLAKTNEAIADVSEQLREDSRIQSLLISAGRSASIGSVTAGAGSPNVAGIVATLADEREETSTEIVADLSRSLQATSTADLTVSQPQSGPGTGQPIQVNISGDDLTDLETVAEQVSNQLQTIEGAHNIESELTAGSSEFTVTVDRGAAARAGLTPDTIATALRARVSGLTATNIQTGDQDFDVQLQYADSQYASGFGTAAPTEVATLQGTTIQTPQGATPLENLVDFNLSQSLPAITHTGGDREFTVSADTTGDTPAVTVISNLQQQLDTLDLPEGVTVSFGGETQDVQESFTDLFLAMIIGVLLIFALLVYQFKSFKQPLYMLATIPLALIGVFFGLTLMGEPLSFPAFVGVVALAGIVVNNAIILIDRINKNRQTGADVDTAVYEGARSRLQPILLTTITTISSMIPLLFADPTWAPLAYAIIYGLLFSTVLTLVVVPLLYQRFSS